MSAALDDPRFPDQDQVDHDFERDILASIDDALAADIDRTPALVETLMMCASVLPDSNVPSPDSSVGNESPVHLSKNEPSVGSNDSPRLTNHGVDLGINDEKEAPESAIMNLLAEASRGHAGGAASTSPAAIFRGVQPLVPSGPPSPPSPPVQQQAQADAAAVAAAQRKLTEEEVFTAGFHAALRCTAAYTDPRAQATMLQPVQQQQYAAMIQAQLIAQQQQGVIGQVVRQPQPAPLAVVTPQISLPLPVVAPAPPAVPQPVQAVHPSSNGFVYGVVGVVDGSLIPNQQGRYAARAVPQPPPVEPAQPKYGSSQDNDGAPFRHQQQPQQQHEKGHGDDWNDSQSPRNKHYEGVVKSFVDDTGFGFITCPEIHREYKCDVFLHKAQWMHCKARSEVNTITRGQPVEFTVSFNRQGKPQARNVRPLYNIRGGPHAPCFNHRGANQVMPRQQHRGQQDRQSSQQAQQRNHQQETLHARAQRALQETLHAEAPTSSGKATAGRLPPWRNTEVEAYNSLLTSM